MPKTKYTLLRLPNLLTSTPKSNWSQAAYLDRVNKYFIYLAEIYGKTNAFLFYNANMSFAPSASLIAS